MCADCSPDAGNVAVEIVVRHYLVPENATDAWPLLLRRHDDGYERLLVVHRLHQVRFTLCLVVGEYHLEFDDV